MNKSPEVDAWLEAYENPQKAGVTAVRDIILGADARVTEGIKWKAPTFMYKGNIASFFPKTKTHVSLMFHQGANIPGEHPILEGEGDTSRVARFQDLNDIETKRPQLEAVVRAWCEMRDGK